MNPEVQIRRKLGKDRSGEKSIRNTAGNSRHLIDTDPEEVALRIDVREDDLVILQNWGATPEEIAGPVVGDDLCPKARTVATRCITLPVSPHEAFPWIRQMGFGRAGWYSYDWIDNLGRRSADAIHPEWQDVVTGSTIPGGPVAFEAVLVEVPRAFVLRFTGSGRWAQRVEFILAYELRDVPPGTRLVTRVHIHIAAPGGRWIERFFLGPGDGVMIRKQLLTLARRMST